MGGRQVSIFNERFMTVTLEEQTKIFTFNPVPVPVKKGSGPWPQVDLNLRPSFCDRIKLKSGTTVASSVIPPGVVLDQLSSR